MTLTPPDSTDFEAARGGGNSRTGSLAWAIAIGIFCCFCLCGGLFLAPAGFFAYQAFAQKDRIEGNVDACLRAIGAHQPDDALAHFSARAVGDGLVTRDKLKKLADDPAYQGYDSLTVKNLLIGQTFHAKPQLPQSATTKVSGIVAYRNGDTGKFDATLERENQKWRLHSLEVHRSVMPNAAHPTNPSPDAPTPNSQP